MKKENIKCGIYIIKNLINNKIYVGSSINIHERWYSHKSCLKNNKHDNTYLQKSFNKYGMENFLFEIIELVPEYLLRNREEYWCVLLNTHNRKNGYNLASIIRGGASNLETRKLQSSKCLTKKPLWLTDRKGNILNRFESRTEAMNVLSLSHQSIIYYLKPESKIIDNQFLLWDTCNFTNDQLFQKLKSIIKDYSHLKTEDFRLSQSEKCKNKKKIWLTSTKGTILNTFESVTEASRILNTPISNVTFLINGTSQVFNKEFMLWDSLSFTNSSIDKRLSSRNRSNSHSMKMVYKFSIDNVLIESYQSLKQAISNNPTISGISDCVKNKRSTGSCEAGGYFWTYCSEGPQSFALNIGKNLKVYQYSIDKQTLINEYPSTAIAASLTNSKVKGIQKVISGTRNSHNGFFWSRTKLMD